MILPDAYRPIVLTDALLVGFAGVLYLIGLSELDLIAMLLAILFTSIYAVIGRWYIDRYLHAPHDIFLKKVYGAVVTRLLLLAVSISLTLWFTSLPEITFTVSVLISYIAKSIQEIVFIHKKSAKT